MKKIVLLSLYFLFIITGYGQTICLSDNFNSGYGNWIGSGTYQNSTAGLTGNGTGFNSTNDHILTTSSVTNPYDIQFQLARSSSSSNRTLSVQYSTSNTGPWTTAQNILVGSVSTTHQLFTVPLNLTGDYYFQIIMSQRSGGSYYLDDVVIRCSSGPAAPEIQLVDASSTNQSCGSLSLDFGNVTPSSTADLTFNINNTGTAPLNVSSFSGLSGTDFSIVSPATPFNVAASSSQVVTVRYTASATPGNANDTLVINNNDADESSCNVALSGTSSNSIPIPDAGCNTSNYATSTLTYSGSGTIDDVNVFVGIEHTYRSDLVIELVSPQGTVVELLDGSTGGSADNLEVIFDDEATNSLSSSNHTLNGVADETVTSLTDLLSTFDGENPSGTWTLRVCDDAGGDVGSIENWSLDITLACTPSHTITSFAPASGPVGTAVTVTGTGFTASTTASIDGENAPVTFNSATEIIVTIPATASSEDIVITENACDVSTATPFTVTSSSNCGAAPASWNGLLISGVFDETSGSCHYIQLYNPTSAPIDLAPYRLGSDNNAGSAGDPPPGSYNGGTFNLSGTVPANGTFMVLGSAGGTCTSCSTVTPDQTFSNLGFNGSGIDRIFLLNNGTAVDLWANGAPHNNGYIYTRELSSTAPTLTWNTADWSNSTNPDCLGFQIEVSNPPVISALTDNSSCDIDLSATVTEGVTPPANDLTYQWFYNDGAASTWSEVNSTNLPGYTILGETGTNLLIGSGANDVSTLDNHQFYLEVTEAGTCENVSNATTFKPSHERYFRSKQTGDWTNPASWEMATSPSGPWMPACTYPTATNTDYISIENGHTVTIPENTSTTPDVVADQLIVQDGGTLVLADNAELHIENGAAGSDFQIEGTFIDASSSGSGNGTTFNGGATWNIVSDATIVKTNNSSATSYRDNYETGIANITPDANWIYRYDGTGSIAVANSANGSPMYYPNLTFESTNGNHDFDALSSTFTGRHEKVTVKGDFTIGGNGNDVKVYNNNFNPEPMLIQGDLYIAEGSELTNERYRSTTNGNYDVQWREGAGFELQGDALIEGILDVTHTAPSTASSAGRITPGNEGVIFSGTTAQDVLGGTAELFISNDVTINNANSVSLDDIDMEINDELKFLDGKIITEITKTDKVWVKNPLPTAIVGALTSGNNRYVEGKLQWTTTAGSIYSFPVGHASHGAQGFNYTGQAGDGEILAFLEPNTTTLVQDYAYCDLETHPGPAGTTVNAGNGNAGTDGVLDQIEFNLASPLQWNISNPSGSGTVSNYDITVLANGGQDINPVSSANGTDIRYLMLNGQPGNATVSTTTGAPSFSQTGFNTCPNQYTLDGLTAFNIFTLHGATQSNTTLPVELISYEATLTSSQEVLNTWMTATEINNDFFTVERSTNGKDFSAVGTVKGAGNSSQVISYSFTDKTPFNGYSYYRLKQTDFDGTVSYSHVEAIYISGETENVSYQVFPNPFENNVYIRIENDDEVNISIFDIRGKVVYQDNLNENTSIDLSTLSSGTYVLQLISNNKVESISLQKK